MAVIYPINFEEPSINQEKEDSSPNADIHETQTELPNQSSNQPGYPICITNNHPDGAVDCRAKVVDTIAADHV